jgi:hypothetical protein
MDFLAVDVAKVAGERRISPNWGAYPPAWLRVRLLVESLRLLELAEDADALAARWTETYGEPSHNIEFAPDVPGVVKALLDCPCPALGVKVHAILDGPITLDRAVAQNLSKNYAPGSSDVRVLLAAARRLWEQDPTAYVERGSNEHMRSLVQIPAGTRRGSEDQRLNDLEAADRRAGAALLQSLFPGT